MKKSPKKSEKSLFTIIASSIVGLAALAVCIMILPINNLSEGIFFAFGILIVIVCAITAFEGKKGAFKELLDLLFYWR